MAAVFLIQQTPVILGTNAQSQLPMAGQWATAPMHHLVQQRRHEQVMEGLDEHEQFPTPNISYWRGSWRPPSVAEFERETEAPSSITHRYYHV